MRSRKALEVSALAMAVIAVVAAGYAISTSSASAALTTIGAQLQETSFGDLATDALCDAAGVTVGLVAATNLKRGTIDGDPTEARVRELLSLPDEPWAVSRLTGQQLRQALERSLGMLPGENMAFLQVSGLTVLYDPAAPRNSRIVSARTASGPLEAQKTYEVVMPLSLAKGGAGYFQIFNEDHIIRRSDQGLAAAIMAFVASHDRLEYTGQGRISPERSGS